MRLFFHSNRTKRWFLLSLSILCIIAIVYERDVCNRKECPFHHLQSNLMKPFYKLNCPDSAKWSKVNRDHDENTACSNLPPIVMLNARPLEARLNSSQSWEGQDMFLINTTNVGRSNLACAVSSFANILFQIYLEIFETVLKQFPEQENFIFLEDDAELLDKDQMDVETCLARANGFQFYSFYLTEGQGHSCIYQYGMVAFYVNREYIKKLLTDTRINNRFCYIPIDIYIAMHGPWYATRKNIIKHNSKRFITSD